MLGLLVVVAVAEVLAAAPLRRPLLVVQGGHRDFAHAVALSPDGTVLATAGGDDVAVLWDARDGAILAVLEHPKAVLDVAFSPDGRTVATAGADGAIRLWDAETARLQKVLAEHERSVTSLSFRKDGRVLASADEGGGVRRHDLVTGRSAKLALRGTRVAFSPTGPALAVAAEEVRVDGALWGRLDREAQDLAWSPDGKSLATCTWDGAAQVWGARGPRRLEGHLHPGGEPGKVGSVAFSPDGRTLAVGAEDGSVHLWDARTWTRRGLLRGGQRMDVEDLAWRADGRGLLSAGLGPPLLLWDAATGRQVREFRSPVQEPASLAVTRRELLMANKQGLRSWSLETGACDLAEGPDAAWCVAASADGSHVLTGHFDGSVRLDGRDLGSPPSKPVVAAAVSPDGRLAATCGNDGTARLWELPSGRLRHVLTTPADVALNALAFSPDGTTLATGGDDGRVRFWDTSTGAQGEPWAFPPRQYQEDAVTALCWTAQGPVAGLASGGIVARVGGPLPEPHGGAVTALATHGERLASASRDRTATVRDLQGRVLHHLAGHTWGLTGAAFHPDGRVLLTGSDDGTVRAWSVETGRQLAAAMAMDAGDWLVTSPEGFVDGSLEGMQKVRWRFSDRIRDTISPEHFLADFYHPGLLAEVVARALPVPDLLRERGDRRYALEIARKDRTLPEVAVLPPRPEPGRRVRVRVQLTPAPSGVRDVRLFRDGTLAAFWPGPRTERVLEATVPVRSGRNVFKAYAFNGDNVKSRDSAPVDAVGAGESRPGRTLAVLIGIDEYQDQALALTCAGADARLLDETLRRRAPGAVETRVLTDGQATREGILDALQWLVRTAQPEDLAVISYAGHGVRWQGRFYLLPQDFVPAVASRDVARFEAAALGDRELESALLPLQAGTSLLVLDACHSGAALEGEDWRLGPLNARGLGQLAWEKGMSVLAASQSQEAAREAREVAGRPLGHGLLSWTLAQEAVGGRTVARWLDEAARRVPLLLQETGDPGTQRPRVFHGGRGPGPELRP